VGGGAETYWLNARGGLHVNTDPAARPMTDEEQGKLKQHVEELQHQLRRTLFTSGMEVKPLSPTVADPRGTFDVIIKLLSSATGIPQRILTGAEAGQLASSQDDKNFADRIQERQLDYAEPVLLRPLADRLIEAGILPVPEGGQYRVEWGSLADPDEAERAATTDRWATAAQKFAQAGGIITPAEVRERYFDLPAEIPETEDDDKPEPDPDEGSGVKIDDEPADDNSEDEPTEK
jgi:hypothetical protein